MNSQQRSEPGSNRHKETQYVVIWIGVCILLFLIGLFVGLNAQTFPFQTHHNVPLMADCVKENLGALDSQQHRTPAVLRDLVGHCYSLARSQGLLNNFAFRELGFVQQYRANGILMWMVVIVTLSGVVLAGLQLLASYRLAEANKASLTGNDEISLKRDQLVLRSSVTGLFVLLISFGFFLVFVQYVYRFEKGEDHMAPRPGQTTTRPVGGLGPPPAASEQK